MPDGSAVASTELQGTEAPAHPLPMWLLAAFLLLAIHGAQFGRPSILGEHGLLSGDTRIEGWFPGRFWLQAEMAVLGSSELLHRGVGLLLELSILTLGTLALMPALGALSPLLVAAYLVHPAHTDAALRLDQRSVLVSELLLAAAACLYQRGWPHRGRWLPLPVAMVGAVGLPGHAIAGSLFLLGSGANGRARLGGAACLAAAASVPLWMGAPVPSFAGVWSVLEVLAQPWRVGLVQSGPPSWLNAGICAGAVAVGALCLDDRRSFATTRWVLAAGATILLSPWLRPSRPDLEFVGEALTADAALAPWLVLLLLLAASARGGRVFLVALLLLASTTGWRSARLFQNEQRLLDHAVARAPQHAGLQVLRGEFFLRQEAKSADELLEWVGKAQAASEAALAADPDLVAAMLLRARALLRQGLLRDAEEDCEAALRDHPGHVPALVLRGEIAWQLRDVPDALRWLRSARNQPGQHEGQRMYQQVLDQLKGEIERALLADDSRTARRLCDWILQVAPENLDVRVARARTYDLDGKPDLAIQELEKVIQEAPLDGTALQALIVLHERLGNVEEARKYRARWMRGS